MPMSGIKDIKGQNSYIRNFLLHIQCYNTNYGHFFIVLKHFQA